MKDRKFKAIIHITDDIPRAESCDTIDLPSFKKRPRYWHSPKWLEAIWDHNEFTLTPTQAQVFAYLYELMQRGIPGADQAVIRRELGYATVRLSALFADNPAWGKLIVKAGGRDGTFMLAPMYPERIAIAKAEEEAEAARKNVDPRTLDPMTGRPWERMTDDYTGGA